MKKSDIFNEMKVREKIARLDQARLDLLSKRDKTVRINLMVGIVLVVLGTMLYGVGGLLGGLALAGLISGVGYWLNITEPFKELKFQSREILLDEFIRTYHPEISYRYFADKQDGKRIVRRSKLISANQYFEEDVLAGNYRDSSFYLSEIHLKVQSNNSSHTVFKGILFRFTLPGKNLPRTRIQSKPGLLKRMFGGFVENKEYGFYHESDNWNKLSDELAPLLPFIRHLAEKQGDVRMRIEGDEVVLMLASKMKFLDNPKPSLGTSFDNPTYFQNMGKQLNSLLYILKAFVDNAATEEVADRLELMHLSDLELSEELIQARMDDRRNQHEG